MHSEHDSQSIQTTWRFPSKEIEARCLANFKRISDMAIAVKKSKIKKTSKTRDGISIMLNDVLYPTLKDAAEATGISIYRIREALMHTRSAVITLAVVQSNTAFTAKGNTPCCVNGVKYPSYAAVAHALDVQTQSIFKRAKSCGTNTFDFIPKRLHNSKLRNEIT